MGRSRSGRPASSYDTCRRQAARKPWASPRGHTMAASMWISGVTFARCIAPSRSALAVFAAVSAVINLTSRRKASAAREIRALARADGRGRHLGSGPEGAGSQIVMPGKDRGERGDHGNADAALQYAPPIRRKTGGRHQEAGCTSIWFREPGGSERLRLKSDAEPGFASSGHLALDRGRDHAVVAGAEMEAGLDLRGRDIERRGAPGIWNSTAKGTVLASMPAAKEAAPSSKQVCRRFCSS